MSRFEFQYFHDSEDGVLARMKSVGGRRYPVNIRIDNADKIKAEKGVLYDVDLYGIGTDLAIFANESECMKAGIPMFQASVAPIGVFFTGTDEEEEKESAFVLLTGKILDVCWFPPDDEEDANCLLTIDTHGMQVKVYWRCEGPVDKGYIVYGAVWLFGSMRKAG